MSASATEISALRKRIVQTLCSPFLVHIRFQIDNVTISPHYYRYVASLIESGAVCLTLGDGQAYDHENDHMEFDSDRVPSFTIVHECTHIAIDMSHKDKTVLKGTHEACAYLAEMIYGVTATGQTHDTDVPFTRKTLGDLAKRVIAHNKAGRGLFVCPTSEIHEIKMRISKIMELGRRDTMNGVPYFHEMVEGKLTPVFLP